MKKSFGLRYYLYLLAPWFFAVFADCSYIIISQRWDIIPFVLPAEAFFYLLPLLTTSFFIRKGLRPLLEEKADKSRAIKLLMGTPALITTVVLISGFANTCLNYYFSTAIDHADQFTYRWHIFLSAACGYMIIPGFLAWAFTGFWTEDFRLKLHRNKSFMMPPGKERISFQLALVYLLVLAVPFFNTMMDIRVFTLHPEHYETVFYTDILALTVAIAVTVVVFTRKITRPISFLEDSMDRVVGGDLKSTVPVLGNDEIGRLTVRFNHMLKGLQERELLQSTFGKYLTPELAVQVLSQGGIMKPESRLVTVLFTDIENYTTLSENLPPKEVIALLNSYFSGIIAIIGRYRGLVNKFIGDAVMAIFNAPVDDPEHANHAVAAAMEIDIFCRENTFFGTRLRTRIGVNSGEVIAGNLGSDDRAEYTVIGDTVNVAQRLEALNKQMESSILVGPLTRKLCGESLDFQSQGELTVKGRKEPLLVFSPIKKKINQENT